MRDYPRLVAEQRKALEGSPWKSAGRESWPHDQRRDLFEGYFAEVNPDSSEKPGGWFWTIRFKSEALDEELASGLADNEDAAKAAVGKWAHDTLDATAELGVRAKGSEVVVGDDIVYLGTPHRITGIEPYEHPKAKEYGWGPGWRSASAQVGNEAIDNAWGITLEPESEYEITPRFPDTTALARHLADREPRFRKSGRGGALFEETAAIYGRDFTGVAFIQAALKIDQEG